MLLVVPLTNASIFKQRMNSFELKAALTIGEKQKKALEAFEAFEALMREILYQSCLVGSCGTVWGMLVWGGVVLFQRTPLMRIMIGWLLRRNRLREFIEEVILGACMICMFFDIDKIKSYCLLRVKDYLKCVRS